MVIVQLLLEYKAGKGNLMMVAGPDGIQSGDQVNSCSRPKVADATLKRQLCEAAEQSGGVWQTAMP